MKKLVISTIAVIVVTVGLYHLHLLATDADRNIVAVAVAVVLGVAAIIALATETAMATLFAFACALAVIGTFGTANASTIVSAIVAALATLMIYGIAVGLAWGISEGIAEQYQGVRYRWVLAAYALETLTLFAALSSYQFALCALSVVIGSIALLMLSRFVPEVQPTANLALKRERLDRTIADLERRLTEARNRRAALDAPPTAAPVPHPGDA